MVSGFSTGKPVVLTGLPVLLTDKPFWPVSDHLIFKIQILIGFSGFYGETAAKRFWTQNRYFNPCAAPLVPRLLYWSTAPLWPRRLGHIGSEIQLWSRVCCLASATMSALVLTLNLKRETMDSKIHDFCLAEQKLTQRQGNRKNTPIILTQFLMTVL
jgi:hypothetical protein